MTVPKHVAFIMDGNRRFSKRLLLAPYKGHEWGARKLEEVISWCRELGVEEVTVYALSVQNFNRSQEEFAFLMDIFRASAQKIRERQAEYHKENVRIVFIGRLSMLPADLQELMQQAMDATKDNTGLRVNIAIAYGGREEVVDAVKRIGEQIQRGELDINRINEEVFTKSLYMDREPDLIIRTGGERRTSNFLIWQSHYSEWIFVEKLWPEFSKEDLLACVSDYEQRNRRFGK